jgi:hypothetical protein
MRSRIHRTLLLLGLLSPAVSLAQADTTTSYDANALRVESHFGNLTIVRGATGPAVASVGTFRKVNLVKLVEPSENAVREARVFEGNQRPGAIAALLGGIIVGTAIGISTRNDPSWGLIAAEVAGTGLVVYGGVRLNRAYNALSRSIWWYNRDLKR